jgi:hypothetical protein
MPLFLGLPLAMIFCASVVVLAYRAGGVLARGEPAHVRAAATALFALYLLVVAFHAFAAVHAFRAQIVIPAFLVAAAAPDVARRLGVWPRAEGEEPWPAWADARRDARRLAAAGRAVLASPAHGAMALCTGLIAGTHLVRSLVCPPLACDTLLYHLVKPARWIQDGYARPELAPDGWGYLEYFPIAGDIPWGFAMLPTHGDELVGAAGVMVWACVVLGAYALARSLGARRRSAAYAALVTGLLPAVMSQTSAEYADNFVLAVALLGGVFLVRLAASPSLPYAAMAGAALGLQAAAKPTGLPVLALGLPLVAATALRRGGAPSSSGGSSGVLRRSARARAGSALAAIVCAAAVCAPDIVQKMLVTGSPTYPLTVVLGGRTLLRGEEELHLFYTGALSGLREPRHPLASLLWALLWPRSWTSFLGFGPGALGLAILGGAGLFLLLRGHDDRPASAWTRATVCVLALWALLPFVGILSPEFLAHRTLWKNAVGRLLALGPATLAVFGARLGGRPAQVGFCCVALVSASLSWPGAFGDALTLVTIEAALVVVAAAASLATLIAVQRRAPVVRTAAAVLVASALVGAMIGTLRDDDRYAIYAAAATRSGPYELHRLNRSYAAAWPLWRALDDDAGHVVAITAGWDGGPDNWFRYPLFGRRLQNRVIYVPPTRDGAVIDAREERELDAASDPDAWIERLVARRVDRVAAIVPAPIERSWMDARPKLFEPIASSSDDGSVLYRFRRERAATRSAKTASN